MYGMHYACCEMCMHYTSQECYCMVLLVLGRHCWPELVQHRQRSVYVCMCDMVERENLYYFAEYISEVSRTTISTGMLCALCILLW